MTKLDEFMAKTEWTNSEMIRYLIYLLIYVSRKEAERVAKEYSQSIDEYQKWKEILRIEQRDILLILFAQIDDLRGPLEWPSVMLANVTTGENLTPPNDELIGIWADVEYNYREELEEELVKEDE